MSIRRHAFGLGVFLVGLLVVFPAAAQNLEIHVINVGWGQSTFIKGPGPTGKTVLLEAGNTGKGTAEVVPYLQSIGHTPSAGFDYTIVGHQHCDHAGGMDEVINAGYNVRIRNYDNGSSYTSSCITGWDSAAATTTAGTPVAMTRGQVIDLGGGATLTCIVVRGQVIGGPNVSVSNENDLSIGLLLEYGGFDYFWASDLGGGPDDGACTGRSTSQLNVETTVINAISPGGAAPLISTGGIDVLHVSHHGSESSTNNDLFDGATPALAVISTGAGQTSGWDLPRQDVVENVLLGQASCVAAPPTFVLQTEEGSPTGSLTSFAGYCVGDIKITTDGINLFTVDASGGVTQGPNEKNAAGLPQSFTIDDQGGGGGDTEAPLTAITAPGAGATVSGTVSVTASASDNVGVTSVEFYLDNVLQSTDTTSPYSWSWNTTTATNASHSLTSKAYDAASNVGTSSVVSVTVNNTTPPPPNGIDVSNYRLTQANATLNFTIPAGTVIPSKGYVIVARNATKAQFETFWGVTLGSNVVFVNSGDGMPQVNGDENFTLYNAGGTKVDGRTINMAASGGESIRRLSGCSSSTKASSWTRAASSTGNPGSGAPAPCNKGVFISEFSDALGTGNFVYEFVELYNDK
jgi:beta-lactamase superfamily II metal-dependent hydrolase